MTNSRSPLLSVIIPVKDRWELLERALRSVESQVFQDLEVIVVDDHSTTPPPQELGKNSKVQVLSSKGQGVSAARNTGILSSSSEFIALLDSDDEWASQKIFKQIEFLKQNPRILLVHTEEIWIRNGVRVNPLKKHKKSGGRLFERATELCLISPSATLMRRSLLEEVGLFNEDFVVCEDYELWLRITSRFEVGFLEEPLTVKHGGHSDQLSHKYHSMDLWRIRALSQHLENPHLSLREKEKVRQEIRKKSEVLLKGFQKHRNFTHREEVLKLLTSLETGRTPAPPFP